MTRLFLFQIGPVQTFIAQARRTQDLFVGSHLLSELSIVGVRAASYLDGFKPIFPMVDQHEVVGDKSPHRFSFLADANSHQAAEKIRNAIYEHWNSGFRDRVRTFVLKHVAAGDWIKIYDRQTNPENWLEFFWVSVPYVSDKHGTSYKDASVAMAQRRMMRTWPQVEEDGAKCTLTGAQSALPIDWAQLRRGLGDKKEIIFRSNERLGGMALIKRLAIKADCIPAGSDPFPSTRQIAADDWDVEEDEVIGKEVESHLAILHMDGDQMGIRLSSLTRLGEHQDFSRKLAEFASHDVPEVIRQYGGNTGKMIYSGGDDVLALLPIGKVLEVADTLRQRFFKETGCTASAGIAITPDNLPLDYALELSRKAESDAKDVFGRNAVVVTEAHGTGMIRDAGARWQVVPLLRQLQNLFEQDVLSGKIAYDLRVLHDEMFDSEPRSVRGLQIGAISLAGARKAEAERLFSRRTNPAASKAEKAEVEGFCSKLVALVEDQTGSSESHANLDWADAVNWTIFARFLAQAADRARRKS